MLKRIIVRIMAHRWWLAIGASVTNLFKHSLVQGYNKIISIIVTLLVAFFLYEFGFITVPNKFFSFFIPHKKDVTRENKGEPLFQIATGDYSHKEANKKHGIKNVTSVELGNLEKNEKISKTGPLPSIIPKKRTTKVPELTIEQKLRSFMIEANFEIKSKDLIQIDVSGHHQYCLGGDSKKIYKTDTVFVDCYMINNANKMINLSKNKFCVVFDKNAPLDLKETGINHVKLAKLGEGGSQAKNVYINQ